MSRTRRFVPPNWNPRHPHWTFGEMTEKHQTRDRRGPCKHDRFVNGLRNSRRNLKRKNEALGAKEALDD